jgi:hypothetical protein
MVLTNMVLTNMVLQTWSWHGLYKHGLVKHGLDKHGLDMVLTWSWHGLYKHGLNKLFFWHGLDKHGHKGDCSQFGIDFQSCLVSKIKIAWKWAKKGDFENPKVINRDFSTKSVPE